MKRIETASTQANKDMGLPDNLLLVICNTLVAPLLYKLASISCAVKDLVLNMLTVKSCMSRLLMVFILGYKPAVTPVNDPYSARYSQQ
jgi:hypothetical protein